MSKATNYSLKVTVPLWLFLLILALVGGTIYFVIAAVKKFRLLEKKDIELTRKIVDKGVQG